jgi:hypothetical protein
MHPFICMGMYRGDHFEEVSPGISEEGQAQSQCRDVMRLTDDIDAAALELLDRGANVIDPDTKVMPSRQIVAVMEIRIWRSFGGSWTSQDLETEAIVGRGRDEAERQLSQRN